MTSDGIVILLHDETMERITKPWSESLASHPHLGALSPDAYETLRVTPVNQLNFDQIRHLDIGRLVACRRAVLHLVTSVLTFLAPLVSFGPPMPHLTTPGQLERFPLGRGNSLHLS